MVGAASDADKSICICRSKQAISHFYAYILNEEKTTDWPTFQGAFQLAITVPRLDLIGYDGTANKNI